MKILLIAQEPPLSDDGVVTGNAIRARQLTLALQGAGHEVLHAWRDRSRPAEDLRFSSRDELRGLLLRVQADLHLVCYWELLDLMPFEPDTPLVLDFLAPRPLEQAFEDPSGLRADLRRLQVDLSKVDLLLTGNELQKNMMLMPLLEAGVDLARETGVAVVPLAGEPCDPPGSDPTRTGWKLVSGGVNWPWRDSGRYWEAIEGFLEQTGAPAAELVLFGGGYVLDDQPERDHTRRMNALMPYREFSDWLTEHGHIGLELAEDNVERRLSQSFRSMEFLRHGLPLICNRWLPIADLVERFDAGWLVDSPEELPGLLRRIFDDHSEWRNKSANALRLVREKLSVKTACAPLLQWLEGAHVAQRLPRQLLPPPELKVPPLKQRIERMAALRRGFYHPSLPGEKPERAGSGPSSHHGGGLRELSRRVLARARHTGRQAAAFARSPVFYLQRWMFHRKDARGVVLVTRGDLFPADHGAAVKIIETARGLSFQGLPVALVTDHRRYWWEVSDGEISRRKFPWWIRLASPPEVATKAAHYSKDLPLNNAFLYLPLSDRSFFYRTLYAAGKVGARVLQAEFPAYVRPGINASRILDALLVLVEHNVEYERIRSQVKELTEEQYLRYKSIEVDLSNQCDAVICVSDNDRQQLAADGVDLDRLYTVPHGVDLDQFDLPPVPDMRERFDIPEDAPVLVYHGTFSYPPNLQALGVFARELLPRLEKLGLECHVLAVGREPPAQSPHPRIHLTGSVDKVGPWIKSADLAVVPLLDGGGTRMKIIDCFAAGVPVISTAKGIEGIPVINGEQALVIDDWDEMAAAIQRLMANPAEARKLSGAALEMARSMDWKAIAARYVEIFDQLGTVEGSRHRSS